MHSERGEGFTVDPRRSVGCPFRQWRGLAVCATGNAPCQHPGHARNANGVDSSACPARPAFRDTLVQTSTLVHARVRGRRRSVTFPESRRRSALHRGVPGFVYAMGVRRVEDRYEDGLLKPEHPLPLRPGERVGVSLMRRPDPSRRDLARIAAAADEDQRAAGHRLTRLVPPRTS